MFKRLILTAAIILAPMLAHAQAVGEWAVYPSYWIATQNLTVGSRVYGLMNGNLLCYDTDDSSVKTYDSLNDLNDMHISNMAYSEEAKRLILVYENGNIDIMDLDDNVWNIESLKTSTLTDKDVNSVNVEGTTAYICTDFGFLTVDMEEVVILDTYNLGYACYGVMTDDTYLYVASRGAVHVVKLTDNWHIDGNWFMTAQVAISTVTYTPPEYNLAGGLYWHSDGLNGLNGYKLLDDGTYQWASGPIQPNSPVRDLFYRMSYVGDRLLVAGGINTNYAVYYDATAMYYEDGKWTNFDEETPAEEYPNLNRYNTTNLVQDPSDDTHHFASPYRTGLWEYRDGKFVGLYNADNSPLQTIGGLGVNYNSAVALQYDSDGNLWMANQETDTIIRYISPDGKWHAMYFEEIDEAPTIDDYLFCTAGINFLVSRRSDGRGFFGFTSDGSQHTLRTTITNEDGTSYTPDQFYCMTEDLDGQIWCGTQLGLFVIEDPTEYFDSDFTFLQIKIARNDGSGLADYLLSGVPVTCIAVDGANRKWVGTNNNGIYLISADGQEMIEHFQEDDSPLLSDNIQCIAINPTTGLVMIGTDEGLCSYMGDATEAEEELDKDNVIAFPNPVTPGYTGVITVDGLTMDSEVKICSSTGQLIWSGVSNGGRFTWDGKNKQGKRVASGVYNVIANNAEGKKAVVTRIIVIK